MAATAHAVAEREVVITRIVDAPARLLFEAYTTPAHVKQWFGPPGYPLTRCEMDFREGGRFRFAMTGPDGVEGTSFGGRYLDIVENKRISYESGFDEPPPGMPSDVLGRMVVTVMFDEDTHGKTTITIHTLFESVAMKNAHVSLGYERGVGSTIPQLIAVAHAIGRLEST